MNEISAVMGDLERAMDCFRRSLITRHEPGDRDGVKSTLLSLGYLVHRLGQNENAALALAAAETPATELEAGPAAYQQTTHNQCIQAISQALGEESFGAVWAAGRALTYECAVQHGLAMFGEGRAVAFPQPV